MYELKVQGRLPEDWADWYGDFQISVDGPFTTLTGPLADQSALHGLLTRFRDLNLHLISMREIPDEEER